ncbi:hypothetical protein FACS189452_08060 [Bacteroidia bacterium]|nr:hypothetical protein FACS189452_08060 [Bacteroidia bacterium]GHT81293.1 hypothetical protein FACS189467_5110 [Bacteroidia bacterium]
MATVKKPIVNVAASPKTGLALGMHNYKLLAIGFIIIVVGFILMSGGKSTDPNVFNGEELYGFRRITLANIVVMFGFLFAIYAIMHRPKPQKS